MGFFEKINLLHLFMFYIFIIGILLIIITFIAYSNLGNCTSKGLRSKLRMAISIGTVFATISVGYGVCITNSGCECKFGDRVNWRIYTLLITLMGMGVGLLVLTEGIKNDIKSDGCHIDLGTIPDILNILSIIQIVIPAIYIAYIVYTGSMGLVKTEDENEENESDEYLTLEAEARESATNTRRLARYKKTIAQKSEKLTFVRDKIELAKDKRRNPSVEDLALQDRLVKEISQAKINISSVGVGSDSVTDSEEYDNSGSSQNQQQMMRQIREQNRNR